MANKRPKHLDYYIIIAAENKTYIRKYLSKVEELTNINSKTLSKHFNTYKTPYEKKGFTVYKTRDVDLKSNNRGNSNNLSSSQY